MSAAHRGHDTGGLAEQFSDRPDFSQEDLLTLRALLETLSDEERQMSPPRSADSSTAR
ncbi:MAG: hypothetical protein ACLUEK_05265 [Oscillospiraceae bacterium]